MRKLLQMLGFVPAFLLSQSGFAAGTDIAQQPLFLGGAVDPNIMLLFDDSGSMQWESLPDDGYTRYLFPVSSEVYDAQEYDSWVPTFRDDASYNVRIRSSHANSLYYNPETTYTPWDDANGDPMPDANRHCAWHNPMDTSGEVGLDQGDCRDLTGENEQTAYWETYDGSESGFSAAIEACRDGDYDTSNCDHDEKSFWPAVYYQYSGSGDDWDESNYSKVEIKSPIDGGNSNYTGSADRTDCASAPTCTYDEEIQNFANWYTYYRSRALLARNGIGKAFAAQSSGLRVGFGALNKGSDTIDGFNTDGALVKGLRQFSGADRTAFFETLYDYPIGRSITPSRKALDLVGQYFEWDDDRGPWGYSPGPADDADDDDSAHLECRQSFTVLMTDGYWSKRVSGRTGLDIYAAVTEEARANVDNEDGPTISDPDGRTYQYSPSSPYSDDTASTLADVAMYYWYRDLRPGLANKVPTNTRDEAFWQHMVTYAVGLGVSGTLDSETDLAGVTWPSVGGDEDREETKIDDLWHAAVNSRGDYFSATNPDDFAAQLEATLASIGQRVSSAAAIATNSTRLNSSTFVYQARFDSTDWHGQFLAYQVDSDNGDVASTPTWDASDMVPAAASRTILTYDPTITDPDSGDVIGGGVTFAWDSLNATQKSQLDPDADGSGEARLGWLRGDASNEVGHGGTYHFRNRTNGVIGDIVNSDPWRVADDNFGYHILPEDEGSSYTTFRNGTAYKRRSRVIYVGSNGGMLHAFDAGTWNALLDPDGDGTPEGGFEAGTGREKFAYVPNALFPDLHKLANPNYGSPSLAHQYYVDGPSRASDAYIGGQWRTVLVGTLGAGGKGAFALDVSDPDNMSGSKVMWELTDATDLGYTIGQATVARMYNGHWAAILGNGYDSASGKAVLFIKDLEDGAVYKLDTGSGDADNKNGLSTPTAIDNNNDGIVDAIYAGDLFGQLWKFDVSHANENQWGSAFKQGSTPIPLFTATDHSLTPQPITAKVDVAAHPLGGVMVYFGTGKYFENDDDQLRDADPVHSLYGIRDDGAVVSYESSRDEVLQEQQILIEEALKDDVGDELPFNVRVTSSHKVEYTDPNPDDDVDPTKWGWYMDLLTPDPDSVSVDEDGNISVSTFVQKGERVVSAPILHEGRVLFVTLIPAEDPCDYGGTSWEMDLTAIDGSQPSVAPFDFNNDGLFDADDYHLWDQGDDDTDNDISVLVSGKQSTVGIIKTPAVIRVGDREYRYAGGSEGGIEKTTGARSTKTGRQSWWQIR